MIFSFFYGGFFSVITLLRRYWFKSVLCIFNADIQRIVLGQNRELVVSRDLFVNALDYKVCVCNKIGFYRLLYEPIFDCFSAFEPFGSKCNCMYRPFLYNSLSFALINWPKRKLKRVFFIIILF